MYKKKYIESPEKLLELFNKYKEWVKANPILVHDFVGKDGNSVYREKERPLIMEGFDIWLNANGIISSSHHYFANIGKAYNDYIDTCNVIRSEIKADQLSGGMVGIYNHSLTARLNGLAEKTENINNNVAILNIDPLDSTNDIAKKNSEPKTES